MKPFPRKGAFAVSTLTGQVGIINQYPQENPVGVEDREGKTHPIIKLDSGACEFHVLNPDGTTKEELRNVPVTEIRQAMVKEIPAKRRPTQQQQIKFGY